MNAERLFSVLLVEDSPMMRKRLHALLTEVERLRSIIEAEDVMEAMDACDKFQPDVAIIDIRLKIGTGLDVLDYIRSTIPSCITIIFTSLPAEEVKADCLARGADYCFQKATEFERVVEVLSEIRPESRSPV